MPSKTFVAILATAAFAGLCAPASAQVLPAGYETYSVKVPLGDLDLAGSTGGRVALARIRDAAGRVCGSAGGFHDLQYHGQRRRCVGATVERSVAELSNPTVSALYANDGRALRTYAAR